MVSEKSQGNITMEFDAEIYSSEAVKSAIYDLDIVADISLASHNREIIQIKLQCPRDSSSVREKLTKAVLDHQIRIDVQKEFGTFRKLILAQAFFPCENLDQILDEMDL